MPKKDDRLGIRDIETQCKAIKCAILSKFLKDIQNDKQWTETKQSVEISSEKTTTLGKEVLQNGWRHM